MTTGVDNCNYTGAHCMAGHHDRCPGVWPLVDTTGTRCVCGCHLDVARSAVTDFGEVVGATGRGTAGPPPSAGLGRSTPTRLAPGRADLVERAAMALHTRYCLCGLADRRDFFNARCALGAVRPDLFPLVDAAEVVSGETCRIELTQGKFALVDAEDADFLSQWTWWYWETRGSLTAYAGTTVGKEHERVTVGMHRLLVHAPVGFTVDHIDHDGLNNRRSNLRLATQSQQNMNNAGGKRGATPYRGVQARPNGRWAASGNHEGKQVWLGSFATPEEAALVRDKWALATYGDFAMLNLVEHRSDSPGPEDGNEGPAPVQAASTGARVSEGPSAVLVCDGCGAAEPDEIGLNLPGEELGFHSLACFVTFVRREFMEAR